MMSYQTTKLLNWRPWRQGFSIIELIVVISIIGVLSTIGFASYSTFQEKVRDERRKEDLDTIKSALILYFQDKKEYPFDMTDPNKTAFSSSKNSQWIPELSPYISNFPTDPIQFNFISDCTITGNYYCYIVATNRFTFSLWAQLENVNDTDLNNACNPPAPVGPSFNFCIESPVL